MKVEVGAGTIGKNASHWGFTKSGGLADRAFTALIEKLVAEALTASNGQIKPAARHVGVTSQTFRCWMAKLGMREPSPSMVRRGFRRAKDRAASPPA